MTLTQKEIKFEFIHEEIKQETEDENESFWSKFTSMFKLGCFEATKK